MRTTKTLLGLAAATAALTAGAPAAHGAATQDYANQIHSAQGFTVASNTTQTFRMPVQGLGVDQNVLTPCWGFELRGPGIDLVAGSLPSTGYVTPEPAAAGEADGGIPGAVRQADGTYTIAGPKPLTEGQIRLGINCASVGWRFHTATGETTLDPYGNPKATVVGARAAKAGRAKAKRLRTAVKRHARAAQAGPVEVVSAELNTPAPGARPDVVVTVRTGSVPAGTKLTTRATVLPQTMGDR